MSDPPRLVDPESGAPEAVRAVVSACRSDVGTSRQLKALAAALAPVLGPHAGGAKLSGGLRTATALKIGSAVVVAAVLGTGVAVVLSHRGARSESSSSSPGEAASASDSARPAAGGAVEPSTAEPRTSPDAGATAMPSSGAANPEGRAHVEAPSEAALLVQAQALLATDPQRALRLTEQHRRRFGSGGALSDEREVIAIEALQRLGRRTEAQARADRFLKGSPGSAYRSKIMAVLGRP